MENATHKAKVQVPGLIKVIVGLMFIYLVVNIITAITIGTATAAPAAGAQKLGMYVAAGVIIGLASGLYKMEKWAWWCSVIAAGLRATTDLVATTGLLMLFREQQGELNGIGIFLIIVISLLFVLDIGILVLLLTRHVREVYRIGRFCAESGK